jgi:hypothetical protein
MAADNFSGTWGAGQWKPGQHRFLRRGGAKNSVGTTQVFTVHAGKSY